MTNEQFNGVLVFSVWIHFSEKVLYHFFLIESMYTAYLCGKVVYDSYRDTGITGGCSQRDTESIRYKRLETLFCTDLDKSTAAVTTNLKKRQNTHMGIQNYNHYINHKQEHSYTRTEV